MAAKKARNTKRRARSKAGARMTKKASPKKRPSLEAAITLSVNLEANDLTAISSIAKKSGLSRGAVIRDAVKAYLAKSGGARARRAG